MKRKEKPWWRPQWFVLTADVFKTDVGVAINMTKKQVMQRAAACCSNKVYLDQLVEEVGDWDTDTAVDGRMCRMGGGFVVLIRHKENFRKAVALLVHEMTHVTQYLLRDRRIPLMEETEEVHAYLTEHLVEETLRRMY